MSSVSGDIRQVQISPQIILQDESQICSDEAIVVEEVENC